MEWAEQDQAKGAGNLHPGAQHHRPEPPTGLESVLSLLQGEALDVLADAGITGYEGDRLDRLAAAARR
ncbi:hypothetical protein [Pseudoxanthomonas sp. CF385]|uniref:hypothetical protein n=1 Tax=Pseudoxanthomonas sp. CF385 TaxID=1881042 RepID=UPI0011140D2D|nr:hypothetical protein [Pseudoxanthomonas sp. CF385]